LVFISHYYHGSDRGELFLKHSVYNASDSFSTLVLYKFIYLFIFLEPPLHDEPLHISH